MAQAASSCVRASAARRRPRTDRSLPFDFDVFLHTPLATVQDPCYHYAPLSAEYAPMWAASVCAGARKANAAPYRVRLLS